MFFSRDEDGPKSCYCAEVEIMIAGIPRGGMKREREREREREWEGRRERDDLVPHHYVQGMCTIVDKLQHIPLDHNCF